MTRTQISGALRWLLRPTLCVDIRGDSRSSARVGKEQSWSPRTRRSWLGQTLRRGDEPKINRDQDRSAGAVRREGAALLWGAPQAISWESAAALANRSHSAARISDGTL